MTYRYLCGSCGKEELIICPLREYKDEIPCPSCGEISKRIYSKAKIVIIMNESLPAGQGIEVIHHEKNALAKSKRDFVISKRKRYI